MHGHRLRLEAEQNHVSLWTDISVGAVYGAMNRLATEGLLREAGQEQEGKWPTRRLYEITESGRDALAMLRRAGLREIWFKFDPFDLALTRTDEQSLASLPSMLSQRLQALRSLLEETRRVNQGALPHVGLAKQWALRHSEYRLEAEIAYLTDLINASSAIVSEQNKENVLSDTAG